MKAYLQQQDPYCWVMKQMFLYTGVGDLLCVESKERVSWSKQLSTCQDLRRIACLEQRKWKFLRSRC